MTSTEFITITRDLFTELDQRRADGDTISNFTAASVLASRLRTAGLQFEVDPTMAGGRFDGQRGAE